MRGAPLKSTYNYSSMLLHATSVATYSQAPFVCVLFYQVGFAF